MRRCFGCGVEKPPTDFYVNTRLCKPCHKVRDAGRRNRASVRNDTEAAKATRYMSSCKTLNPGAAG